MRIFEFLDVAEAMEYAKQGRQALHLHDCCPHTAPRCFVVAVHKRHEPIAHLFDQNKDRLRKTAGNVGIGRLYIHHEDEEGQHVDVCGNPLKLLITRWARRVRWRSPALVQWLRDVLSNYEGARTWV